MNTAPRCSPTRSKRAALRPRSLGDSANADRAAIRREPFTKTKSMRAVGRSEVDRLPAKWKCAFRAAHLVACYRSAGSTADSGHPFCKQTLEIETGRAGRFRTNQHGQSCAPNCCLFLAAWSPGGNAGIVRLAIVNRALHRRGSGFGAVASGRVYRAVSVLD